MHKLHYIDLFCGAGGTTTGIEEAHIRNVKCADVLACVNHDPNAIASHLANHRNALHILEDIWLADTAPIVALVEKTRREHPEDRIILWASAECTNFSRAKGGKARKADSRTLPESLYRYIEAIKPDYVEVENVVELMAWGDLDKNGKPVSSDAGRLYLKWVNKIKSYGYDYDYRILNAADFGAYTSRKRYFGLFSRPGLPLAFPEPTHTKTPGRTLFDNLKPWKAVRDVLDLNDEGESIFNRKKPLVDATIKRITAGVKKFASRPDRNFLMKNFSGNDTSKCIGVDGPAGTVTCKDHHSFVTVYNGNGRNVGIDEPSPTLTTKDRLSLVTAEHFLDKQYGTGVPASVDRPCDTVTTVPKEKLVTVKILDQQYGQSLPKSIDTPCGAITTNPKQNLVSIEKWIMVSGYGWPSYALNRPCPTIVASQEKSPIYIVNAVKGSQLQDRKEDSEAMLALKRYCRENGITDIRMRMLKVDELKRIMGFPSGYKLVGTLGDQKKFIGNAVEVNQSRCLCQSLFRALNPA